MFLLKQTTGKQQYLTQTLCPKVAIVILNWNGLADTLECLDSIRKIEYPNFIVAVIDNGSRGNDAEVIEKEFSPFVCVIRKAKNLGFTGGSNEGIRWALHSGANYVLLLNNDTVVDPSFLGELVEVAQSDPLIGIVGPKVCYYEEPKRIAIAGGKVNFWSGNTVRIGADQIDDGQFDSVKMVDFVCGVALLIKAETIKRIGLLNDLYFAYYEETEWCAKAKQATFKIVYVPKAKILHKTHKRKSSELEEYYMTRNRFIFMKNNSMAFNLLCSASIFSPLT